MQASIPSLAADTDCPHCGWSADTVHTGIHERRCKNWREACEELGYQPDTRPDTREKLITLRGTLDDAESDTMLEVAMQLTRAMYDLSLGLAIDGGYHMKHPPLEGYCSMLQTSVMEIEEMRKTYPLDEGHISPGATVWYPEGSRGRKDQNRQYRH